jgi:hypothetical protein
VLKLSSALSVEIDGARVKHAAAESRAPLARLKSSNDADFSDNSEPLPTETISDSESY